MKRPFLFLLLGLGVVLRMLGTRGELWLDEVWSISLVSKIHSWPEILTEIHSNNSHPLNSLWLYLVRPSVDALDIRLASLAFSIASIFLYLKVANQILPKGAELAASFFSLSYVFVLYTTEARGYSGMVCFALASFLISRKIFEKGAKLGLILAFFACNLLGLLSHLSFIFFYFALLIWDIFRTKSYRTIWSDLVRTHLPTLISIAIIYLGYVRYLEPGSGPLEPYIVPILESLSVPFSGIGFSGAKPISSLVCCIVALVVSALSVFEISKLYKEGSSIWLFYTLSIFVIPAASLIVLAPRVLFVRYFLISILFLFILICSAVFRLSAYAKHPKLILYLSLLMFVVGQAPSFISLIKFGRGNYEAALRTIYMDPNRGSASGSQEFRDRTMINFYFGALPRSIDYKPMSLGLSHVDWYLKQSQDPYFVAASRFKIEDSADFELVKSFPSAPLSGFNLFLYKRAR